MFRGKRVGGMVGYKGLSNVVTLHPSTVFELPNQWTLEDAATIPVVYFTVLYALITIAKMKRGSSILIHSATGGIGLAAINVCRYYNCEIFVTVGNEEKKKFINQEFPDIPDDHIGNSHDTSFEKMIHKCTDGRGVDLLLNSLAEEKLIASIRCMAKKGTFLEIGKYDLSNDQLLKMLILEKEVSYHGIMLDRIYSCSSEKLKAELFQVLLDGIEAGYVKPLPRKVYAPNEIVTAFKSMTTGKHKGKILIKIKDENVTDNALIEAVPRFCCDTTKSYIIVGGLGGFGLELADWLVLRHAKKIILSSRKGIQNGYQTKRIQNWKTFGVKVHIATNDLTTKKGCEDLLKEATSKLGPVDAIFNLAAILEDALFENQTPEMFEKALAPKTLITKYLDLTTRQLCPDLKHFVVFSSVSCGRGNIGQTNYGMANSVMERICEKRKSEGLPGLAIQWGAIGDVGLVAKMQKENKELVIGGTLQQKVTSCLTVLDRFLNQDSPVVASMIVAVKNNRSYGSLSAAETVAKILGIKKIETVSQHTTLAEMGMDSMMGTEIIQVLEKDYDIFITPNEIRSLTFAKYEKTL